ncbi:MAG: hypothetical protein JWR69_3437 [Pedosphaera sp.]|nr:hypothetical protein [Pedosphaera sp.]
MSNDQRISKLQASRRTVRSGSVAGLVCCGNPSHRHQSTLKGPLRVTPSQPLGNFAPVPTASRMARSSWQGKRRCRGWSHPTRVAGANRRCWTHTSGAGTCRSRWWRSFVDRVEQVVIIIGPFRKTKPVLPPGFLLEFLSRPDYFPASADNFWAPSITIISTGRLSGTNANPSRSSSALRSPSGFGLSQVS